MIEFDDILKAFQIIILLMFGGYTIVKIFEIFFWVTMNETLLNILFFIVAIVLILIVAVVTKSKDNVSKTEKVPPLYQTKKQNLITEIVSPLSSAKKELLIKEIGTKCCNPTCKVNMPLEIHHIIPRSKGGSNKENNLIVLCPNCHTLADNGTIARQRLKLYSVAKIKRDRRN